MKQISKDSVVLKNSMVIFLKVLTFGLIVPLIVMQLSMTGIHLSCKYYWGECYLMPTGSVQSSAFKLSMFWETLSLCLTIIYYLFCILFFLIRKRPTIRKWFLAFFLIIPIIVFGITSEYDYRITICFSMFHLTYYGLFLMFWYAFSKLQKMKQL